MVLHNFILGEEFIGDDDVCLVLGDKSGGPKSKEVQRGQRGTQRGQRYRGKVTNTK